MNAAPGPLSPPVLAWLSRELPGQQVVAAFVARAAAAGVPVAEVIAADPQGRAAGQPLLLAQDASATLPPRWREISEALDLYALADFLTRPPGHRYFGKAVTLLKNRMERPVPG